MGTQKLEPGAGQDPVKIRTNFPIRKSCPAEKKSNPAAGSCA
jgi:hypothetical protein